MTRNVQLSECKTYGAQPSLLPASRKRMEPNPLSCSIFSASELAASTRCGGGTTGGHPPVMGPSGKGPSTGNSNPVPTLVCGRQIS